MLRKRRFWLILGSILLTITLVVGLTLAILISKLSEGMTPRVEIFGLNWSPDGTGITVLVGEGTSSYPASYPSKIYRLPVDNSGVYRASSITYAETANGFLKGMSWPDWSHDRSKIVVDDGYYDQIEIYILDIATASVRQLTHDSFIDNNPDWSPDGTQIVFTSDRESGQHLFLMNADGSNLEQLTSGNLFYDYGQWSPDGKKIAFVSHRRNDNYEETDWNISTIGLESRKIRQIFDAGDNRISIVRWSPDGSLISFTTNAIRVENNRRITDDYKLYAVSTSDSQSYLLAYPNSTLLPDWIPNSHSIVFSIGVNHYQVNVGSLQPEIRLLPVTGRRAWSPDGSSIAFISTRNEQEIDVMLVDTQTWDERLLYTIKPEQED